MRTLPPPVSLSIWRIKVNEMSMKFGDISTAKVGNSSFLPIWFANLDAKLFLALVRGSKM